MNGVPRSRRHHSPARRRFLAAASAAALASSAPFCALAASQTITVPALEVFDATQYRMLLAIARTLFPHDFLDEHFYAEAVAAMDTAASDPARAKAFETALAALPGNFHALDESSREAALDALEDEPFFALARGLTIRAIYANPETWPHFGYPGPSLEFGGWVERNLLDIDWLPELSP